jgi:5-methylcytosine-specific restriction endonuclease McrA
MAAKKCSKCGEIKPLESFYKFKLGKFGRQAECKPCSNARRRAFAATRPEAERESRKEWARRHPPTEAQKTRKAAYRLSRKDVMRVYSASWYERNKERLKPLRAAWHQENYADKRKPKMVQNQANRRARLRASGGSHTLEQVMDLLAKQRGKCAVCRCKIEKFHRDHITPLASGGSNDIFNIQLLCRPCNLNKKARDPVEYMQSKGFLL